MTDKHGAEFLRDLNGWSWSQASLDLYLVLHKYKLGNTFFPVPNAVWQETIICSVSNVTFGKFLACRNCMLYNKEPDSANQWENSFKKMKKRLICTCLSYTGLSYAELALRPLLLWYKTTKWVCFPNHTLISSRTLWISKEYHDFSEV